METYESRAENHYNYHHLECLFSEGSIHNYYTKTRESNIATLLRRNNRLPLRARKSVFLFGI